MFIGQSRILPTRAENGHHLICLELPKKEELENDTMPKGLWSRVVTGFLLLISEPCKQLSWTILSLVVVVSLNEKKVQLANDSAETVRKQSFTVDRITSSSS